MMAHMSEYLFLMCGLFYKFKNGGNELEEYLIKNTTKQQRIALIKKWSPDDDGMDDCGMDLWDIYRDYIEGIKEIAEINAEYDGRYLTEEDL